MKKSILTVLFLFLVHAEAIAKVDVSRDVCSEMQEMYKDKTINDLFVGSPIENYQKSFFVDIDNDGEDEELQYFTTRTYAYVAEVVDGKVFALPTLNTNQGIGNYTGNAILRYRDKFLQIHFADAPLELQELIEKTAEEKQSNPREAHINYNVKTLCKYYQG